MIEETVRSALFGNCQLHADQTVVVGFSGGADSMCLLHVLAPMPIKLVAAHFDHSLRPESKREAEYCRQIAREMGIEFRSAQGDVKGFAEVNGLSIEEAARIQRYLFLYSSAVQENADAVAVAHHADDQVETILMHLMRGAGPSGLSGMRYRSSDPLGLSPIPLIRPLLGVWREEIQEYCDTRHLVPVEDLSNQETTYFRNRIRLELVPELESYNHQVKQHLWQTAAILAEENEGMAVMSRDILSTLADKKGEGWVVIDHIALMKQPVWLQRRILRQVMFDLKSTLRDIDYAQVERALSFLAAPEFGKTYQLDADLELFRFDSGHVCLLQRGIALVDLWPQVDFDERPLVLPADEIRLPGGWQLTIEVMEKPVADDFEKDPWQAFIDMESLDLPLSVGKRRPGELFAAFGLRGGKLKLGDFFTNAHLPSKSRNRWPILRGGDEVIWIPGFRIAEFCRLTPRTQKVIHLELQKK